jgi:hypothetical protein
MNGQSLMISRYCPFLVVLCLSSVVAAQDTKVKFGSPLRTEILDAVRVHAQDKKSKMKLKFIVHEMRATKTHAMASLEPENNEAVADSFDFEFGAVVLLKRINNKWKLQFVYNPTSEAANYLYDMRPFQDPGYRLLLSQLEKDANFESGDLVSPPRTQGPVPAYRASYLDSKGAYKVDWLRDIPGKVKKDRYGSETVPYKGIELTLISPTSYR